MMGSASFTHPCITTSLKGKQLKRLKIKMTMLAVPFLVLTIGQASASAADITVQNTSFLAIYCKITTIQGSTVENTIPAFMTTTYQTGANKPKLIICRPDPAESGIAESAMCLTEDGWGVYGELPSCTEARPPYTRVSVSRNNKLENKWVYIAPAE